MELWQAVLIGIALVVALIAIVALIGRKAMTSAAAGADPTQLTLDGSVMAQVQQLAVSGQRIEAVMLLRKSNPDLKLAAAKMIVDKMAAPKPGTTVAGAVPAAGAIPVVDAATPPAAYDDHAPSIDALALEVELEARSLKAQGQTIGAVKLVHEHTGWGLKESKRYVQRL